MYSPYNHVCYIEWALSMIFVLIHKGCLSNIKLVVLFYNVFIVKGEVKQRGV